MKKINLLLISIFLLVNFSANVGAFEVKLYGDRISVHADQIPLQKILQRMADLGINVRIEPRLNPKISASFENWEMQKGVDSILKSVNHVLIWDVIKGPLDPISRLAEIQVFIPGKKKLMEPLTEKSNLNVVINPKNGFLFVKDEILIRFKAGASFADVNNLLKQIGGTVVAGQAELGIYKIRFKDNADIFDIAEKILNHPTVAGAEPNYVYPIFTPYKSVLPHMPVLNSNDDTFPEQKSSVAILDTGMNLQAGLNNFILASFDALNPEIPISDTAGHGTQMAFIASGTVKPLGAGKDIKANIPVIPIKAFDDNGFTSSFTIMQGVNFALDHGARVVNLSWGAETESKFLKDMLDFVSKKGVIVVASAGNEPKGKPVYPAAYPSVIGVGALNPKGKLWKKSNYGDFVTLYAPGFASLPVGFKGDPGMYFGTSISAAFVANYIANYISQSPEATKQEILTILTASFPNRQSVPLSGP